MITTILKIAYQLKIFLKFYYSAVLNKLIRYSTDNINLKIMLFFYFE